MIKVQTDKWFVGGVLVCQKKCFKNKLIREMETSTIIGGVLISFVSMLVGILIKDMLYRANEQYKAKLDVLRKFTAYRYDLKGEQFSKTINEISVVYQDSKDVIEKLKIFHGIVSSSAGDRNEKDNDSLLELYKAMCEATNIDLKDFNDSFFLKPFNIKE